MRRVRSCPTKTFDRADLAWKDFFIKIWVWEKIRSWVKTLFINAKMCIHTNGFNSRFENATRSIRQRFPIATILYITQGKPLAASIRHYLKIKGIKLPTRSGSYIYTKLNIFAGHTQLFNKSEDSISKTYLKL